MVVGAKRPGYVYRRPKRVLVLWLPPYAPDLNPIERFWKHLKATACANHLYASLDQLLQSVRDFIAAHNSFDDGYHLSFSKNFQDFTLEPDN